MEIPVGCTDPQSGIQRASVSLATADGSIRLIDELALNVSSDGNGTAVALGANLSGLDGLYPVSSCAPWSPARTPLRVARVLRGAPPNLP